MEKDGMMEDSMDFKNDEKRNTQGSSGFGGDYGRQGTSTTHILQKILNAFIVSVSKEFNANS